MVNTTMTATAEALAIARRRFRAAQAVKVVYGRWTGGGWLGLAASAAAADMLADAEREADGATLLASAAEVEQQHAHEDQAARRAHIAALRARVHRRTTSARA